MTHVEEPAPSSTTLEIVVQETAGEWSVEIQDDSGSRKFALGKHTSVVGTSSRCEIVVLDPTVSSRHCALSVLGEGVAIQDLGSRNGTFVGSARVREAWGRAGTTISVGHSTLIVQADDGRGTVAPPGEPLSGVAGRSIAMRRLADQVRRLARHALPVLIAGESGTGKELVARALHDEGPRRTRPFVAINVTALPRELVESELFGHERGSFTGAHARRLGAFTEANGGTLFLDEVGDLPLDAQPKLLRALDGYEIRRVGAAGGGVRGDVRVIAATHAPLEERVTAGLFRRDLFHRLECFVVHVPPLRERRGDIAAIAKALLSQIAPQIGARKLAPSALARLAAYDWPGNVRELRNVLCRAGDATARDATLDARAIEAALLRTATVRSSALTPEIAKAMLREHRGNLSAAARAANLPRTTFRKVLGS
jgi:DNA-binding NtrC family response regulator